MHNELRFEIAFDPISYDEVLGYFQRVLPPDEAKMSADTCWAEDGPSKRILEVYCPRHQVRGRRVWVWPTFRAWTGDADLQHLVALGTALNEAHGCDCIREYVAALPLGRKAG
jgi:hypothetical protein